MMETERPSIQDQRSDHSDSMSSIDRELDWLMESETRQRDDATQGNHEVEPFDRADSRREGPPSSYQLGNKESEDQERVSYIDQDDQYTNEDDSQMDEQRLLEIEIQKLKEEGILPMDDPPEYDIADRVRELNEQLRAEGEIPERTDRKVTFSEKVMAVEFPEEMYGDDDENDAESNVNDAELGQAEAYGGDDMQVHPDEVTDPNDLEVAKLTLQGEEGHTEIDSRPVKQSGDERETSKEQSPRGKDEKILIERDGKFELISVKDLSPIERQSMGLDIEPVDNEPVREAPITPNGQGDAPVQEQPPQDAETSLQPRPPSKPRPSTATDSTGLRRSQLPPRRIQSARTQRDSSGNQHGAWTASYTGYSKYGLTPEQKEHKREQMRIRMQQQQEQKEAEEEQQRKKQEEAESAFQAWLQNKKDAEKGKRHKEKEHKNKDDKSDQGSSDDNFQAWLRMKQDQAKRERKLKKQEENERVHGYFVRDRKDCDDAFKQWVKSKNKQLQKERSLKRSNASVSRQLAQQSRKSKNLSKALEIAQIYRYTDWYGYRF